jgi:hypothetical protein
VTKNFANKIIESLQSTDRFLDPAKKLSIMTGAIRSARSYFTASTCAFRHVHFSILKVGVPARLV